MHAQVTGGCLSCERMPLDDASCLESINSCLNVVFKRFQKLIAQYEIFYWYYIDNFYSKRNRLKLYQMNCIHIFIIAIKSFEVGEPRNLGKSLFYVRNSILTSFLQYFASTCILECYLYPLLSISPVLQISVNICSSRDSIARLPIHK